MSPAEARPPVVYDRHPQCAVGQCGVTGRLVDLAVDLCNGFGKRVLRVLLVAQCLDGIESRRFACRIITEKHSDGGGKQEAAAHGSQ